MILRTFIAAAGMLIVATAASAGDQRVTLSVPGMFCASCPFVVQAAIQRVDGVSSVATDLESRTATVVYDDAQTSIDAITAATKEAGYESSPVGDKAGT